MNCSYILGGKSLQVEAVLIVQCVCKCNWEFLYWTSLLCNMGKYFDVVYPMRHIAMY